MAVAARTRSEETPADGFTYASNTARDKNQSFEFSQQAPDRNGRCLTLVVPKSSAADDRETMADR
jgi:hypothetical protein